jgi:hypothetical protein
LITINTEIDIKIFITSCAEKIGFIYFIHLNFLTSMHWSERALSCVRKLSASINTNHYLPFVIEGNRCGLVHKDYIPQFQKRPELFDVTDKFVKLSGACSKDNTSDAINQFLLNLRDEDTFSVLKGNYNHDRTLH